MSIDAVGVRARQRQRQGRRQSDARAVLSYPPTTNLCVRGRTRVMVV